MLVTLRKTAAHARLEAGFGMIELLCAMAVMSIGILAVFGMFNAGALQIRRASLVATATAIADSEMEGFRAIKYAVIGLDDADVLAADATYTADSAFRGDATTSLSAATTSSATTLTVASAGGFPSTAPFRIQVDSEIMFVTAGAGTTTWTVSRGGDGSSAAAHLSGATVQLMERPHLVRCGTGTCTNAVPTKTVTGADGRAYRLDTYMRWGVIRNSSGAVGRSAKIITLVLRDPANPSTVYARVSSAFDEATGV